MYAYTQEDGSTKLQVKMENKTVWLSTNQMVELFGRDRIKITSHINNCFKEGELDRNITCAKIAQVQQSNDVYFFLHVNGENGILYGENGGSDCR